jgi:hypothetical protein
MKNNIKTSNFKTNPFLSAQNIPNIDKSSITNKILEIASFHRLHMTSDLMYLSIAIQANAQFHLMISVLR